MRRWRHLADWVDQRTGYRSHRAQVLEEPLPPGTGWWFVTGSLVLFLLGLQFATGVVLAMFYVPSPDHAHASVLFISEQLTFGSLLRSLHYFGASFIVVAAVAHLLRVVVMGSYKPPRELTWITGVTLLVTILGFALTGYLLPWDQKAYWATTVTINVVRSAPFGEWLAGLLRGGDVLGALTLLRWYAAHVFLLPACLLTFTVAHLYLMRRHGISGPVRPAPGAPRPFFPDQALRDSLACAAVFACLFTLSAQVAAPLDAVADPTDARYVPRPEWYFLSLFQLLKYFPGRLEPVATVIVPGALVALLLLLPFLDRGASRDPTRRKPVLAGFALVGAGIVSLTYLGFRDATDPPGATNWGLLAIAGHEFANDETCVRCHRAGGSASPVEDIPVRRDPQWLLSHVRDPEVIAPGLRPPPPGGFTAGQASSILSYLRRRPAGGERPNVTEEQRGIAVQFGRWCATCHVIDGEGGSAGPDLTRTGATRDAAWLKEWIADPEAVDPATSMPGFGNTLTDEELEALAVYLASRR